MSWSSQYKYLVIFTVFVILVNLCVARSSVWWSRLADVETPSTAVIHPDGWLAAAVTLILDAVRTRTFLLELYVGDDPWDCTGLVAITPAVTIHLPVDVAGADLKCRAATVVYPDLTVGVTEWSVQCTRWAGVLPDHLQGNDNMCKRKCFLAYGTRISASTSGAGV